MPLSAGTALGPYEILAPLGAGGMGEVYRARDTRIGREVAIKMLPEGFARDPDRLRRFESEVRTTGSLNHPNILAIFDVGAHEGSPYIVAELLTGQTLRERIAESPIPQRKAVEYALAIAHGLAAAHEKNVVHRDLKPDNLFLTRDGRVKILDFGLAKSGPEPVAEHQGTVATVAVTQPGAVLGTAGYMSPEQVRGRPVDHRTDIFAFGAVLYEMLTGRRAFRGETAADSMSAILKDEPAEAPPGSAIAPGLDRVIRHCLEKAPEQRFQSAADLAFALEALSGHSSTAAHTAVVPPPAAGSRRWWFAGGVVALAAAAGVGYAVRGGEGGAAAGTPIRFSIPTQGQYIRPAVSPDGKTIAYFEERTDHRGVWLRTLDKANAAALAGAQGGPFMNPFWTRDSRGVWYLLNGQLNRTTLAGGLTEAVTPIDSLSSLVGFDDGGAGALVFSSQGRIFSLPAAGGQRRPIYEPKPPLGLFSAPRFLGDGKRFVFSGSGASPRGGAYLGSLEGTPPVHLADIDNSAAVGRHMGRDYLIYSRDQSLWAQELDGNGRLEGEPSRLDQNTLSRERSYGLLSVGGDVAVWLDAPQMQNQPTWFDRAGRMLGPAGKAGPWTSHSLSPDRSRIAARGPGGVWILEPDRGLATRTIERAMHPIWLPDGRRVVYSGGAGFRAHLFVANANGTGEAVEITRNEGSKYLQDVTPDGRTAIYVSAPRSGGYELYSVPVEAGAESKLVFKMSRAQGFWATISPDGKWLALCHDDSGAFEVYVQPLQAGASTPGAARVQVSTDGGLDPHWGPDGKQIYFLLPDARKLMAADVTLGPDPRAGKPRLVFEAAFAFSQSERNSFAISRDGQRILALLKVDQQGIPIQVLSNWPAALRKR